MNRSVVFLVLLTAALFAALAQTGTSLEAEIQSIERTIAGQGISAQDRHDALVRLARLRQLSGDIEGAARNWLDAAAAIPGQVDDDALLSCAYCLAAMGEWDRARAAVAPLLLKSRRARYLEICINAINTGNTSTLASIADNVEYAQLQSEIYFMLWKISRGPSADAWRQRLAVEFPQTPEGRLALGEASPSVVVRPSPFWLFIGGLDSQPLTETAPRPSLQAPASAAPPPTQPQTARLQTGLFSREPNAQAQMAGLRQAGFSPSMEQRGEMWAVTVPAGADQSRTAAELKTAGFDSFPIR